MACRSFSVASNTPKLGDMLRSGRLANSNCVPRIMRELAAVSCVMLAPLYLRGASPPASAYLSGAPRPPGAQHPTALFTKHLNPRVTLQTLVFSK
ncbi:hypothetical protein E2C01_042884 [Portunus trituberculatus]|uniref:Uncharacterized protein n=1 Tax=Portunus trituberculatus TaxID=210409 RepID=A0A5B7FNR2_PORTR|nr:hypothetical protein [Portunus trituberculatus]